MVCYKYNQKRYIDYLDNVFDEELAGGMYMDAV